MGSVRLGILSVCSLWSLLLLWFPGMVVSGRSRDAVWRGSGCGFKKSSTCHHPMWACSLRFERDR
jgi:hypothetical protein